MNNLNDWERFVSLYGFFAFQFPKTWHQETDSSGHYILSDPNGGSGVVRIIVLENEFEGEDSAAKLLEEVYRQNELFNPELLLVGTNKFISYVKEHLINEKSFTVYYWVTAIGNKAVLFTYTIQTSMKEMDVPIEEKKVVEQLIATVEVLMEK